MVSITTDLISLGAVSFMGSVCWKKFFKKESQEVKPVKIENVVK